MKKVVQLSLISQLQGEGMEDLSKYARFDLLAQGLPGFEPRNDEEAEFVERLMAARNASAGEGDAMTNIIEQQAQVERMKAIADAQNDAAKAQIDAAKAQADIRYKNAQAEELEIKNAATRAGISGVL